MRKKDTTQHTQKILNNLPFIIRRIEKMAKGWKPPIASSFATGPNAAFKVLISTILSLRTKDAVTEKASHRLFGLAQTPQDTLALSVSQIQQAIYPVGFYKTKSANILKICDILLRQYSGVVPSDLDNLLALPGVGRKTANLTLTVGFGKPGICVDTHVHRICNRWGLVKTEAPDDTEMALRRILPEKYWIGINDALVSYGQNLCVPVSPKCSTCPLEQLCPRTGVQKFR